MVKLPKLKTHSGAAKRLKVTSTGKIMRRRGYKSHLLTGKSSKRTKNLRKAALVSDSEYANMKRLVPYL